MANRLHKLVINPEREIDGHVSNTIGRRACREQASVVVNDYLIDYTLVILRAA